MLEPAEGVAHARVGREKALAGGVDERPFLQIEMLAVHGSASLMRTLRSAVQEGVASMDYVGGRNR